MERVRPGDGGYEANRPLRGGEWCGPGGHTRTETGATLDTAPPGPQIRLPVLQGVERDPLLNSHNQHTALCFARSDEWIHGWFPDSGRRNTECNPDRVNRGGNARPVLFQGVHQPATMGARIYFDEATRAGELLKRQLCFYPYVLPPVRMIY